MPGYQPRLTADAGYEMRNNEYTKSLEKTVTGWFFGITGTGTYGTEAPPTEQTKQAKAQLEEAKVSYDDAVRQVDVEVQQALDQVAASPRTPSSASKKPSRRPRRPCGSPRSGSPPAPARNSTY